MSDVNANIDINIDGSQALAEIKRLQREISLFYTSINKGSATAAQAAQNMQKNLVNSINATGDFTAQIKTIQTTAESFTTSLEKNKFSMQEYFRYGVASTKTFGKLFKSEFNTIEKTAIDRVKRLQTQYIKLGKDANGAMKAIAVTPTNLNLEDTATKTMIAAQKQQIFNQVLKQGSTNLLNFGKNTQWAGRQLMVGFTVPLTIFGNTAAKAFMEIEEAVVKFKRVYGDMYTNSEDTERMSQDLQRLAKEFTKYGIAVADTMSLAAEAAAMGKTGAELTAQVAEATRLAVLGGVEQAQALETTTSLTNAFGVAAEDLAQNINFLNAVENQTVTSIEDLTIAVPKAGPVVKQLGGDVKDLAFFLTAMKEGGINASEGANALKSGLASLINPTAKASEFMQGFGISIEGIVNRNKGDLKGTVTEFALALDKLDPLNRARAIEQLFGKFQFSRLSTLFQNIIKDGSQASTVLGLAGQSVEELAILSERELGAVEDSVGKKFVGAIEKLKAEIAPIGEQFLQAVTPIVEFITGLVERFNGLSDGVKKAITVAVAVLGVIGPAALMTFGLFANGLANIIKFVVTLRNGYQKLTGQSKFLGEQTQYMTNEQIEAASVAASLDQAHAQLTQRFTSEAEAVAKLVAAYQRANAAGKQYAAANPGSMLPPKRGRYAKGVVSVPGPKGAGDVVPAMLSPGEAVIPAKFAEKYAPLVNAMVAGEIPGYKFGKFGFGKIGYSLFKNVSQEQLRPEDFAYDKLGSTPGGLRNLFGRKHYVKRLDSAPEATSEILSSALFSAMGNRGPRLQMVDPKTVASQIIPGLIPSSRNDLSQWIASQENPQQAATELAQALKMYIQKDVPFNAAIGNIDAHSKNILFNPKNRRFENIDLGNNVLAGFTALPEFSAIAQADTSRMKTEILGSLRDSVGRREASKLFKALQMTPSGRGRNLFSRDATPDIDNLASLLGFDLSKTSTNEPGTNPANNKFIQQMIAENPELASQLDFGRLSGTSGKTVEESLRTLFTRLKRAKAHPLHFFANGAVSVPGPKGAGDIVPAMLSPGEAVIPADMAKKYAPLIDSLVSGNLPGYQSGGFIEEAAMTGTTPASQLKIQKWLQQKYEVVLKHGSEQAVQQFESIVRDVIAQGGTAGVETKLRPALSGLRKTYETGLAAYDKPVFAHVGGGAKMTTKELAESGALTSQSMMNNISKAAEVLPNQVVSPKGGWGFTAARKINDQLSNGSALIEDFLKDFESRGIEKWQEGVAIGGGNFEQLSADLQIYDDIIKEEIRKAQAAGATNIYDTKQDVAAAIKRNPNIDPRTLTSLDTMEAKARQRLVELDSSLAKVINTAQGTITEIRSNPGKKEREILKQAGVAQDASRIGGKKRTFGGHGSLASMIEDPLKDGIDDAKEYKKGQDSVNLEDPYEASRNKKKRNSPHADASKDGMDDAKAYSEAAKKNASTRTYGNTAPTAVDKSIRRNQEKEAKRQLAQQRLATREQQRELVSQQQLTNATQQESASENQQLNVQKQTMRERLRTLFAKRREATDAELAAAEQKKAVSLQRKANLQRMSGKLTGVAMGMSTVAMMGSMVGGPIGEISQQIMGPAMALSALAPLIPMLANPWVALVAAVVAIGGGLWYLNEQAKEAARNTSRFVDATTATTEKMKSIGEITGKVGASELMTRVREGFRFDRYSGEKDRKGRQFGTAFVDSEVGKEIVNSFVENMKKNGAASAATSLARELSAYVADGILTGQQAESIADQIGRDLGDMSIATDIRADMLELIGPNGENLLSEPLQVRLNIISSTAQDLQDAIDTAIQTVELPADWSGETSTSQVLSDEVVASLAAQAVQLLELTNAQIDGQARLNQEKMKELENNLASAKTDEEREIIAGKIQKLKEKTLADEKALRQESDKAAKLQISLFDKIKESGQGENAFFESLKDQLRTSWKDSPLKAFSEDLIGMTSQFESKFGDILGNENAQKLEVTIDTMVASKMMSPTQAIDIINMFGDDAQGLQQVFELGVETQGMEKIGQLASILGKFKDKKLGKDLLVSISTQSPEMFDKIASAITLIQEVAGKDVNLEVLLGSDDPVQTLIDLVDLLEKVENLESPIKKKAVFNILQNNLGLDSTTDLESFWEYIQSLPDDIQKNATQNFITVFKTITDDEISAEIAKRIAAGGGYAGGGAMLSNYYASDAGRDAIASYLAEEATKTKFGTGKNLTTGDNNGDTTGDGGGTGGGSGDDPYAGILNRLKQVRDAAINASGGIKELLRVAGKGKNISIFKGMDQQLTRQGFGKDFVDEIISMDEETRSKFASIEKGVIKLTKAGKALAKAYKEVALGDVSVSMTRTVTDVNNQVKAFNKLTKAGFDTDKAYELLQDSGFAAAVAGQKVLNSNGKLTAEFKRLKAQIEAATAAMLKWKLASISGAMDVASQGVGAANTQFDTYQKLIQSSLDLATIPLPEADEGNRQALIDMQANYAEMEANTAKIEANNAASLNIQEQINAVQSQINAKQSELTSLQRTVEVNFDRPIQDLQDQIEGLQRDIELQFTRPIEQLQESINDMQRAAELKFDRPIKALQDEGTRLSNDLAIMDKAAEEINKKYDDQVEALNKVAEANEYLLSLENQRVSLADALTQGDIAAAAQAAQEMRAAASQQSMDQASANLDAARQAELDAVRSASGMTRDEIAQRQYEIGQETYALEQQRKLVEEEILVIQDQIYNMQEQQELKQLAIRDIEDQIYNLELARKPYLEQIEAIQQSIADIEFSQLQPLQTQLDNISQQNTQLQLINDKLAYENKLIEEKLTVQGKTKKEWQNIEAAIAATNIVTKEHLDAIKNTQKALQKIVDFWNELNKNKNITLTVAGTALVAKGGLIPQYLEDGGLSMFQPKGTDTIPAMLTPGEFVVRKAAVDKFGIGNLMAINSGKFDMSAFETGNFNIDKFETDGLKGAVNYAESNNSVYNYTVTVNAGSNASADDIANAVMGKIKTIESYKIRGQRV